MLFEKIFNKNDTFAVYGKSGISPNIWYSSVFQKKEACTVEYSTKVFVTVEVQHWTSVAVDSRYRIGNPQQVVILMVY